MDDFENLKRVWQQQTIRPADFTSAELKKTNDGHQRKLERTQLMSAIALLLTPVGIIWIGFFSGITFQSSLTYGAVILIALIPAVQGIINLSTYNWLRRIDITAPIAEHLSQWQRYYAFRKRMIRFNGPIYFLLLNGAFALYFIEILGYFSWLGRVVVLIPYVAWMLYAYFVLGKRNLQKETERLEAIIGNLQTLQRQLDAPES
ncbi:hypothetical protein [Spirosoma agri]|uniref:Uncharacterized protein n=1 Tax=Spirosoma agri TaxID=1987381 RepID=A0A6M0ICW2_9BACT|nr:hypothetical protein [Spirosoma agri]NEU65667.1 hypothetical protein [Spirosoma agri]